MYPLSSYYWEMGRNMLGVIILSALTFLEMYGGFELELYHSLFLLVPFFIIAVWTHKK